MMDGNRATSDNIDNTHIYIVHSKGNSPRQPLVITYHEVGTIIKSKGPCSMMLIIINEMNIILRLGQKD